MLTLNKFFSRSKDKRNTPNEEQQTIKLAMDLKDSFPLPMPEPLKHKLKDEGIDATGSRC
jgi:hypothetical protein